MSDALRLSEPTRSAYSGYEVWRAFNERLDARILTLPVRDRFRMRARIMRHAPREAEKRYGAGVAAEFRRAMWDAGWNADG